MRAILIKIRTKCPRRIQALSVRSSLATHLLRESGSPGLPKSIAFIDDGFDRSTGKAVKRRAPFSQGFTNAILSSQSFTNVGGMRLPLTFALSVLRPSISARQEAKVELDMVYRGVVSNVSSTCSFTNFVPNLSPATEGIIADERFSPTDAPTPLPIIYRSSRWLTMAEVRLLPEYSNYVAFNHIHPNFVPIRVVNGTVNGVPPAKGLSHWARLISLSLLALVTLAPLIWFCAKRVRGNQK